MSIRRFRQCCARPCAWHSKRYGSWKRGSTPSNESSPRLRAEARPAGPSRASPGSGFSRAPPCSPPWAIHAASIPGAVCELLRSHSARALLGPDSTSGAHFEAREPLRANAPHARRALGATRRRRGAARWAKRRSAAKLGARGAGTHQPQQGNLRACQQACAHRLGRVGEARALSRQRMTSR